MANLVGKKFREIGNWRIDGQIIYEIAFAFEFVVAFLITSTYTDYFSNHLLHTLMFAGLALVLLKIFLFDDLDLKWLAIDAIVLILLLTTWRTSKEFSLFSMGIFVLGARNVDFKRIIKIYFYVGMLLLAFVVISAMGGLIRNLVYRRDMTNIVRQSFGIAYPTDFAAHVLYLILAYAYLKFGKIKWYDYAVFLAAAVFLVKFSDARLSAYAIILSIPVLWIGQRAQTDHLLSRFIASFYWTVPILAAYLVIIASYFFTPSNKILTKVNNASSGRLFLGHKAISEYGFSMFGKQIIEHGWGGANGLKMSQNAPANYFFVDSSFLRMTILYGIIMAIIILLAMTKISWESFQKGSFALASIIVIVSVSAMVEQRLLDLAYDPFLIALLANVYTQHKAEDIS
ncbi:hypothetical protein [Limosilactobacillus mucosae]|uniref:hypothetical protein n=1 Tax=Limosilactobacillus mucosae TaxID=97478 RepID=UPI000887C360|nr:hypothetical protein [Limosilactobacillus mucosae]SDN74334.1 hypothetical protein SAMN05216430_11421 [Limosilactobacillus mucosae]SEL22837.1 hypothetical protein SAMN05216545_11221 [Limosilactobacillus mucosae]SFK35187.1 hypothetical protein SAMN05216461_11422 [Limosilactobacillus mucosae]